MLPIPTDLERAISKGTCVLFLGAGIAADSGAPTGGQLALELSVEFLDGQHDRDGFRTVAALVDAAVGRGRLNEYLDRRFRDLEPSATLQELTQFRWRRIYTVNFDTLVESAYARRQSFAAQRLRPVYTNRDRMTSPAPDELPFYKLHGCLTRADSLEGRLTLTEDDHIDNESLRLRMLQQLANDLAEHTVLYIGFRREDPDFIRILKTVRAIMGGDAPRAYSVTPGVSEVERQRWEDESITLIDSDAAGFLHEVRRAVRPSPPARRSMQGGGTLTPPPTTATYQALSLDQWEDAFWDLYGGYDRELPLYDVMLQLVNDGAQLSEATRKRDYAAAIPIVARMFSWLCTMVTKVRFQKYGDLAKEQRLSDIVWDRYPAVCCLCGERRCICGSNVDYLPSHERLATEAQSAHALLLARQANRPDRLDDWLSMFDTIYETINRGQTLEDKTLHLLEEVGEVEVELRKADRVKSGAVPAGRDADYETIYWTSEVADVFSRMASIVGHIEGSLIKRVAVVAHAQPWLVSVKLSATSPEDRMVQSFAYWVWSEFSVDGLFCCHRCKQNPCVCVPPTRR